MSASGAAPGRPLPTPISRRGTVSCPLQFCCTNTCQLAFEASSAAIHLPGCWCWPEHCEIWYVYQSTGKVHAEVLQNLKVQRSGTAAQHLCSEPSLKGSRLPFLIRSVMQNCTSQSCMCQPWLPDDSKPTDSLLCTCLPPHCVDTRTLNFHSVAMPVACRASCFRH